MEDVKIKEHSWRKAEIRTLDGVEDHESISNGPSINQLPTGKAQKKNGLMLDISTGNGGYLIAGSQKKYIPIGIEKSFEQAKKALFNIRVQKVNGYVVVAEHEHLPFQDNLFDFVWSSEIIPFNSHESLLNFREELHRTMAKSGKFKLAFSSYENVFRTSFSNVGTQMRSCFGNIALMENFRKARGIKKLSAGFSSAVSFISRLVPALKKISDSIYISGQKIKGPHNLRISLFLKHHWLKQNLNVVYLLQCPITGGPVYLSKDSEFVISDMARVKYPVIDEIPVMLKRAAIPTSKNQEPKIQEPKQEEKISN